MTDAKEFLGGWFAGIYRFDGLILVLHAYFDETGSGENDPLTAVAGFVFDKEGLTAFTEAWEPRVAGLSKPYRTSVCNQGEEPFGPPDWPRDARESLMKTLATLSVDHALAAFVVSTSKEDYEAARENGPGISKHLDSPYALCTMSVLEMVAAWVSHHAAGRKVYCWFESGGPGEAKAQELVGRIISDPEARADFSVIHRRSWIPKQDAPAFCCADLLAWEWRRNVLKSPDVWTPRMGYMIDQMNEQSKLITPHHITANELTKWALSKLFPGLFR